MYFLDQKSILELLIRVKQLQKLKDLREQEISHFHKLKKKKDSIKSLNHTKWYRSIENKEILMKNEVY